jgi:hypothetical protein
MERLLERRARQRQADARYSEKRKAKRKQPLVDDRPDGVVPGLSSRRTRELAEWYAAQTDKQLNAPAIYGQIPRASMASITPRMPSTPARSTPSYGQSCAGKFPRLVEIEFQRVMKLVRRG